MSKTLTPSKTLYKDGIKPLIELSALQAAINCALQESESDAASPQTRTKILDLLKQTNAEGRKRAEELLFSDGDGTRCAKRISLLQDVLIRAIYEFAVEHVYKNNNPSSGERLAIAAVGGYGRGTLAPGSDIDLLFILPFKQTPWCEQIVEYVLYFLWDLGFKVGHATRNLDECMRQAKADMTIRTSILEARFVEGDQVLFEELIKRFEKEIVRKTAAEFIEAKLTERDLRHTKSGESRYLVEPNIKDGKGGMRDLHTLFWIGKYFYRVRRQQELVEAGLFTAQEFARFKKAEKFLWTVRCHMHFLTGRAEERLSFDIQREMAERLKYVSHGGLLNVERFMKHYFLTAKAVGDLTLIVCAVLEEEQAKPVTGINGLIKLIRFAKKKIPGTLDFIDDHGRINVADDQAFVRDPVNLLRIFKLADDNSLNIHPDAVFLLARSLKLVDKKLRNNKEANSLFLSILTNPNQAETLLRKMNETGLLGAFIPAFGKIVAMMQFNMYHHYTVDEHLIRCVGVLAGIENGKFAPEHPLSASLLPEVKDRELLYTAILIHDIAKGRKEDHSIAGAKIAKSLCPRLGFSASQTELIAWLVQEHLTMSLTAQSRDLSDRKTIETFADIMQTVERMRYLLILTVCDIRGVGPGVWNGWKGQLLRTLYYETLPHLTGGFSTMDLGTRTRNAKMQLRNALLGWSESELDQILDLPYSAYFLTTPLEVQIEHMNFLREMGQTGTTLATRAVTREFEEITEITVLAPDHPRLLSTIAGACAAAGANIVDARIHTTSDGRALDSIFISRAFADDIDEIRRAKRVEQMINDALYGKIHLPEAIRSSGRSKRSSKAFSVTPKVSIDNELSNRFTVLELEGLDRTGLLSDVTRAIADLNLNIGSAQIATFGEKIIDSFYVTDLLGGKIVHEARQNKIIQTLTNALKSGSSQAAAEKISA